MLFGRARRHRCVTIRGVLIPLGTDRPRHRTPAVTFSLIVLTCAAHFAVQARVIDDPERMGRIIEQFAVGGAKFTWYTLWTSAFLHAGLLHLLGNMLVLWVFGPNIEDRLGHVGMAVLYLAGAAASGGAHALLESAPAIGASGAVAAVTGAYLVLFPRTLVRCLLFFVIIGVFLIPAWWFIAAAIAKDLFMHALARDNGVANLAHLAGYGFGFAVAWVLLATRVLPREQYDLLTALRQAGRRKQIRSAHEEARRREARGQRERAEEQGRRDARIEEIATARRAVIERLGARDLAGACEAYRSLLSQFGAEAGSLSCTSLMQVANALFAAGDAQTAATAYERFLASFPHDREAANVRLMLGVIHARYLNDPLRAKSLVTEARRSGLDEEHEALAGQILRDLG